MAWGVSKKMTRNQNKKRTVSYICDECICIYQLFRKSKKKTFCPECGDNHSTRLYTAERYAPGNKVKWKHEELTLLDKIITGELQAYQVATMLGRTVNSVIKRKNRRMEEKRNGIL